jgi:prepilin-type N-terminal cleavage/methylation domain-containing protein
MSAPRTARTAFTLVELLVTLAASSALLAGITSTLYVALRASNPSTSPAASMLAAANCLADMTAEIQYATGGTEAYRTATTPILRPKRFATPGMEAAAVLFGVSTTEERLWRCCRAFIRLLWNITLRPQRLKSSPFVSSLPVPAAASSRPRSH